MPGYETTVTWRATSSEQLTVTKINDLVWQVTFPGATVEPRVHEVGSPHPFDDSPDGPTWPPDESKDDGA